MIYFGNKNHDHILDYGFVFTWRGDHTSGLMEISNVWFKAFRVLRLFIDIIY